jgi:predicted nucleotidyltransferase
MIDLEAELKRIVDELSRLDVGFALVGGLAVSVRAEPRLTRDADLAVAVASDEQAEQLIRDLGPRGYRVVALIEQETTGRMATVRLAYGSDEGVVADLLFASSGIEVEIVDQAEELAVVSGLLLPVACVGHLIAMKLLARDDRHRPQDADDLRALRGIATDVDWDVAEQSVQLISDRGFGRGRELSAALQSLRLDDAY